MIKIQHPHLNNIAETYFTGVQPLCKEKSSFFLTFLDVLINGTDTQTIRDHSLNGNSKRPLVNKFLTVPPLPDQKNYHLVTPASVMPSLITNIIQINNMVTYLDDSNNLKEIILVRPENAATLNTQLKNRFGISNANKAIFYRVLNEIIYYSFFNRFAYGIASILGLSTCPYCNRNFIHTVIDDDADEVIRPTFDHFFSQVDHPFLSLSFYNLIPSCYHCNSNLKGEVEMTLDTHIHPYLEGFDRDAIFYVLIKDLLPDKSDARNYTLTIVNKQFPKGLKFRRIFGLIPAEGNVNLFRLVDIYRAHLDVVGELVVKCDRLSKGYANSLMNLFPGLHMNQSEFYRFYFGNYFDEKDFHRRPLAKMSKDVVLQVLPSFLKY